MQARREMEQGWRWLWQMLRNWNKKKTGIQNTEEAPPLKINRVHKPVIDKTIKMRINEYFRQAYNEN